MNKNQLKVYIVYMAVNVVNGKRYIGATSRGLDIRKAKHRSDAKAARPGCRVFNAAIRKYGFESFEWSIISNCDSHNEMMDEEIRLISEIKPEYNITRGGKGIIGVPRTPEWIAKTSKALKGRKLPLEQIEAMRLMDKSHQFKSIVCLNDGEFFNSVKGASIYYQITNKSIGEMLHGRQTRCGKEKLSFAFSDVPMDFEERNILLGELEDRRKAWEARRNKDKCRPVVCMTDGIEYESARAAAAKYEIVPSRVMQLCQQGGATQSGLAFKYADQEHAPIKRIRTEAERERQRNGVLAALMRGQEKIKKRVILVESGEIFDSIALASRKYKLNEKSLYLCIELGNPCNGFTFRKLDADNNPIIVASLRTKRQVICLTDMVVSDSVLAASERYNVTRATLKRRCDNNDDTPIGYNQFCYLDEWCGNPL